MKRFFTLSMAILWSSLLFSQNSFLKIFGETDSRELNQRVGAVSDGGAIFAGIDNTTRHQYGDFFLARMDATGNLMWYQIIGSPEMANEVSTVSETADGGFLVGGSTATDDTETDMTLVKTDANGTPEWTKNYGFGAIRRAVPAPGGGYVMVANVEFEPMVIGIDENGEQIWQTSLGNGDAVHLALTSDGQWMAGHFDANTGASMTKLDQDGNMLWQTTFTDYWGDFIQIYTFAELDNGQFLVSGAAVGFFPNLVWLDADGNIVNQIEPTQGEQIVPGGLVEMANGDFILANPNLILRYDSEGALLSENFPSTNIGNIRGAAVSPTTGEVFVAATFFNDDAGLDAKGLSLDNDLMLNWDTAFGDGRPSSTERAWSCRQAPDGDFVFAADRAFPGMKGDFYMAKLNAVGNVVWEVNYGTPDDEDSYSVSPLSDGGFLLTGRRLTETEELIVLLKVDNDGNMVWEKTYDYSIVGLSINYLSEELPNGDLAILFRTLQLGNIYMRTDAQGDSLVTQPVGPALAYRKMTLTSDGNFLLVGFGQNGALSEVQKIDTNGNTIFTTQIEEGLATFGLGYGVEEASDGSLLVLSDVRMMLYDSVALSKLDAAGNFLWTKFYNPSDSPFPAYFRPQLIKGTDGNFLMAISSFGEVDEPSGTQIFLVKINEDGDIIWTTTAGDDTPYEILYAAAPAADGGYLLGGSSQLSGNTDNDALLIKTLDDGTITSAFQIKRLGEMQLSPNPSAGPLKLKFESEYVGEVGISIFDMDGQLVRHFEETKNAPAMQVEYGLGELPAGAYFVRLSANGRSMARTWVKTKS